MSRLEELSEIIVARRSEWITRNPMVECVPLDMDFLTADEREEFAELKNALPSFAQLRREALERLAQKRLNRKSKLSS